MYYVKKKHWIKGHSGFVLSPREKLWNIQVSSHFKLTPPKHSQVLSDLIDINNLFVWAPTMCIIFKLKLCKIWEFYGNNGC